MQHNAEIGPPTADYETVKIVFALPSFIQYHEFTISSIISLEAGSKPPLRPNLLVFLRNRQIYFTNALLTDMTGNRL